MCCSNASLTVLSGREILGVGFPRPVADKRELIFRSTKYSNSVLHTQCCTSLQCKQLLY